MKKLLVLVVLLVSTIALLSTAIVVEETEYVVITQFGRPVAVRHEAGLYAKLPMPIQRATRLDKRTLLTTSPQTELLTSDKKNVLTATYVSWRIADPVRYMRSVRTREFAETRLSALVQSELGSAFGQVPFDELLPTAGLTRLESRVLEATARVAERDFGIEVVSLGLTRLTFPAQNLNSVYARMRAERQRIANGYRSEGKSEALKLRAEADRESSDVLAAAESEAARLRGEGEAEAARIYSAAYAGHEEFYRFLRTLESYEKVLDDNTTLVMPAESPFFELLLSTGPAAEPRRAE